MRPRVVIQAVVFAACLVSAISLPGTRAADFLNANAQRFREADSIGRRNNLGEYL